MKNISRKLAAVILVTILALSGFANSAFALPAFPGAEGMGASTVGGRGGAVIKVTNLNDSGAGSFRAAVTASGPRIVVFEVSGYIQLLTPLQITHPYLTVAGQTSPGGIALTGAVLQVSTHDVIMTHLRFRKASDICDNDATYGCDSYGDALQVIGLAYSGDTWAHDIIFDHCSFSWGCDETVDIGGWMGNATEVTFSRCLIAQGLDDPAPENQHALGMNIGGHYQNFQETAVSMHHSYMAHFRYRLPQVSFNGFADIRNNIFYNWESRGANYIDEIDNGTYSMEDYNLTRLNAINNEYKHGSLNTASCGDGYYNGGINYSGEADIDCIGLTTDWGRGQFYVTGNTGCGSNNRVWYGYSAYCSPANGFYTQTWLDSVASDYISSTSHVTSDIQVTTSTMDSTLITDILSDSGATKCQSGDCRDSTDTGFVNDYTNTTGSVLADKHFANYPTGWHVFSTPSAPADSDSDGMSDTWETSTFGSLTQTSSGDQDDDGYTNIEEYINELGGYQEASGSEDTTAPANPSGLAVS